MDPSFVLAVPAIGWTQACAHCGGQKNHGVRHHFS